MVVFKRTKKWHKKYGVKSFKKLKKSYVSALNSYSRWNRTKFLSKSKLKSHRFAAKNPTDVKYRVFKHFVLKDKNVSPELQIKFKKLFTQGVRCRYKTINKNLAPSVIYNKLKEDLNG